MKPLGAGEIMDSPSLQPASQTPEFPQRLTLGLTGPHHKTGKTGIAEGNWEEAEDG